MIDVMQEQHMDLFSVAALDFDLAQRSWYIVDLGTLLFVANYSMYPDDFFNPVYDHRAYEAWFYQFKRWLVDAYEIAYGQPVPEDDIQQGCRWRKDFMYWAYTTYLPYIPPAQKDYCKRYIAFYESGNMPNC